MALLATQPIGNAPATALTSGNSSAPSYAAATGGGDTFVPDLDTFVHIKNGSGGSITVTFVTPAVTQGLAIQDPAIVIAAGTEAMVGPFPAALFANSSGVCSITYSGVTSLTIGVFSVKPVS